MTEGEEERTSFNRPRKLKRGKRIRKRDQKKKKEKALPKEEEEYPAI